MESSPQKTLEGRDDVGTSGYDDSTETDHDQGSDDDDENDNNEEEDDEVFDHNEDPVHKEDIEDDAREVGESIAFEGQEDEV